MKVSFNTHNNYNQNFRAARIPANNNFGKNIWKMECIEGLEAAKEKLNQSQVIKELYEIYLEPTINSKGGHQLDIIVTEVNPPAVNARYEYSMLNIDTESGSAKIAENIVDKAKKTVVAFVEKAE